MAYEEKNQLAQTCHRLTMEDRRSLWMNGVEEVESFDEETVAVKTVKGLLYVRGERLKVDKLEKTSGELNISGQIASLDYEDTASGGLWSRLFR